MKVEEIKNEIIESVKAFFKAEFDKKTEVEKTEFAIDEAAISAAVDSAMEATTFVQDQLTELKAQLAGKEEEMEVVEASRQKLETEKKDLEVKLSANKKTVVMPKSNVNLASQWDATNVAPHNKFEFELAQMFANAKN